MRASLKRLICIFVLSFLPNSVLATPVTLIELDWGSQRVLTHALANILEDQGIDTDIVVHSSPEQWLQLSTGRADIQIEVWEGTMGNKFMSHVKRGRMQVGGTHHATTREDWWYPKYSEALCPGLPDWKALQKCASVFSPDGKGKGIYYSGPWEKPDRARIRALELDFEVVTLETSDELNGLIHRYIESRVPFLVFNWTPNWVEAIYEGSFVEFPNFTEECQSDAEWGYNKKHIWDCGNPKGGWLKSVVSNDLAIKSPCALNIVRHFKLSNSDLALAASLLDAHTLTIEEAAQVWQIGNKERIDAIIKEANCQ